MNWQPSTPFVDLLSFGGLVPTEVLYEFDGPRLYLADAPLGELLCFLADDDGQLSRFVAAPTNPEILAKLKSGLVSVRQVLDQPWVWFVDIAYNATLVAAWRGTLAEAPADALPQPGVMLWPHLQSLEVRGRLFSKPSAKSTLTRKSTALVRNALAAARATQEKIATVSGLVREFDKDDFSFTLRETSDGKDHVCWFKPEDYDELFDAFSVDNRITVSGMENLNTHEIDVSLVAVSRV